MEMMRTDIHGMASLATRINAVFDAGQVLHENGLSPEFLIGLEHATIRVAFADLPDVADPGLTGAARSAIREAYATACSDDMEDDIPAGPPAQPAESAEPRVSAGAGEGEGPEEPEGATLPDDGSAAAVAGAAAPFETPAPQCEPPSEAARVERPAGEQAAGRAQISGGSPWTEEEAEMLVERVASARVYGRPAQAAYAEVAQMSGRKVEAIKTKSYTPPLVARIEAKVAEMAARRDAGAFGHGVTSIKPAPQPEGRPAPVAVPAEIVAGPVPGCLRDLRALLDHLGNPGPFTPQIDYEILRRQTEGEKAHEIALDLGIDVVRLRNRVIAMLPVTGYEAQQRLLTERRRRAGVEA
jgi:hypothetical protein